MCIKVMITDDHPLAISGIENMLRLSYDVEIVGAFNTGEQLLDGLAHKTPDVLLLDILLPDISGKDLAEIIRHKYPQIRILALTSLDAPMHVRTMMKRGCLGYLLKNTDQKTLINAINEVYNGNEFIEPSLKEQILHNTINGKRHHEATPVPKLTQREKEILQLIIAEYTSQEIASKLYLSLRTVEGHRLNLLQKLDAKNTVGLVKTALQMGLLD